MRLHHVTSNCRIGESTENAGRRDAKTIVASNVGFFPKSETQEMSRPGVVTE
jgi:hypothetical protein